MAPSSNGGAFHAEQRAPLAVAAAGAAAAALEAAVGAGADGVLPQRRHGRCRRVLSLAGGFCAMLACGSVYGWGVIAAHLEDYGYSLNEKLLIGTIATLSVYVNFHLGVFFDRFGVRASLLLSIFCIAGGWMLTRWGIQEHQPAIVIGLYQALCGQGVMPNMCAALENVKNFDEGSRGSTSAVVLTGFGLTAIAMAQLDAHVFPSDLPGFLLALAVSSGLLTLFQLLVYVDPPPPAGAAPPAGAQMCRRSASHFKRLLSNLEAVLFLFVMFVFGMSLFLWSVNVADFKKKTGQVVSVPTLVAAFGACNVITRPLVGSMSDFTKIPRAKLLSIGCVLLGMGMLATALQQLLFAAILMGISDGFMFAIWVPLTREVHGNEAYGVTLSVYQLTLGLGNIAVNFMIGRTILPPSTIFSGFLIAPLACCFLLVLAFLAARLLNKLLEKRAEQRECV
eukprot:TRINITY_DN16644_c0_g2_i2.p1 TRINITY_DN16644_c0_g2~~TRINITY_DN16644_c0_g2_i2.p1  ORF type:complete len:476 (+),score=88.38 TRINITY_DN16644_c0_g2_i2:76-1428(+)